MREMTTALVAAAAIGAGVFGWTYGGRDAAPSARPAPVTLDGTARVFTVADAAGRAEDLFDLQAPEADFSVTLKTGENRKRYADGETISFVVTVDADCYVTLITRDPEGNCTLLLPNGWQPSNKIRKGQTIRLPGEGDKFRFPIRAPHGETLVKVIATKKPLTLRGVTAETLANQKFVDLGSNPRAIAVEGVEDPADDRPLSERLKAGEWTTDEIIVVTTGKAQEKDEAPVVEEEESAEDETLEFVGGGKDPNELLRDMWRELTGGDMPILMMLPKQGDDSKSINDETAAPAPTELIVFRRGAKIGGTRDLTKVPSLLGGIEVVKLDSKAINAEQDMKEKIEELHKDPEVIAVIPNRSWKQQAKQPKFFPVQWGLENRIKKGNDINWRKVAQIAQTVDLPAIGVVDQGMHYEDARLKHAVWKNENEIPGNGVDDDKNGYVDDVHGWNFAQNNTNIFDTAEVFNHGTYCISIIAAKPVGEDRDMIGIVPNVKIIPAVVFGPRYKWEEEPQANTLNILMGIDYCARMGAKVINLSLGGESNEAEMTEIAKLPMWEALEEAGVVLVVAAGNAGNNIDDIHYFPAHIPKSNIITVMATDPSGKPGQAYNPQTKKWSRFSNWGMNSAHVAAPGAMILGIPRQDQLALLDGTSFAAPMVAAACSLLMGQHPDWTHHDVISAILETARKSPELKGLCTTGGYLDLDAALKWKK